VADAPLGASADLRLEGLFPGRVTFLNIGFPFNPAWIAGLDPDLVMVDATALAARYTRVGLGGLRRAMEAVPARHAASPRRSTSSSACRTCAISWSRRGSTCC
jgi:hypothetical protein